jgi:hypothetical protein
MIELRVGVAYAGTQMPAVSGVYYFFDDIAVDAYFK